MAWISALFFCLPTINPAPPSLPSPPPPHSPQPQPSAAASPPVSDRGASRTPSRKKPSPHTKEEAKKKRAWEEWQNDYASGKFDLENVPPPPFHPVVATFPPSPQPFHPQPYLFPPYSPRPSSSEPTRQRTIDKFEPYKERPLPPTPTPPPMRPRKSSKRMKSSARLSAPMLTHLPTPPLTPPSSDSSPEAVSTLSPTVSTPTSAGADSPSSPLSRPFSPPTVASLQSFRPLVQHPLCRDIVAATIQSFDTDTAIFSVLDGEKMVFLASSDVERSPEFIPRQAAFCAHTILNGDRGFVVLDTTQDWRFANNYLTVKNHVRFYAGHVVFASKDLRDPQAERIPIGTLCVTDTAARDSFSQSERQQLASLAASASSSIDAWARARLEAKTSFLDAAFDGWKRSLSSLSPLSSSSKDEHRRSVASSARPGASRPATAKSASAEGEAPAARFAVPTDTSALSPERQKLVDAATQTVATAMELPLVYVLALTPAAAEGAGGFPAMSVDAEEGGGEAFHLSLLSRASFAAPVSSGLASPTRGPLEEHSSSPTLGFNVHLHLAALAAPEGGILYESSSSAPNASSPSSPAGAAAESAYSGGILLAVRPPGVKLDAAKEEGGMVLAVFKEDAKRVWGKEELACLRRFAEGLGEVVGV
ncbi:hypothetical protein JCM6882_009295 [Rhodosporidiobolus microsporus]